MHAATPTPTPLCTWASSLVASLFAPRVDLLHSGLLCPLAVTHFAQACDKDSSPPQEAFPGQAGCLHFLCPGWVVLGCHLFR